MKKTILFAALLFTHVANCKASTGDAWEKLGFQSQYTKHIKHIDETLELTKKQIESTRTGFVKDIFRMYATLDGYAGLQGLYSAMVLGDLNTVVYMHFIRSFLKEDIIIGPHSLHPSLYSIFPDISGKTTPDVSRFSRMVFRQLWSNEGVQPYIESGLQSFFSQAMTKLYGAIFGCSQNQHPAQDLDLNHFNSTRDELKDTTDIKKLLAGRISDISSRSLFWIRIPKVPEEPFIIYTATNKLQNAG